MWVVGNRAGDELLFQAQLHAVIFHCPNTSATWHVTALPFERQSQMLDTTRATCSWIQKKAVARAGRLPARAASSRGDSSRIQPSDGRAEELAQALQAAVQPVADVLLLDAE